MPKLTRRQLGTFAMLYGLGVMTPLWAKAPAAGVNYTDREDIIAFLKEVSAQKGIPYDWLETEIALARYSPLAERYMTPRPRNNARQKLPPLSAQHGQL